MKLKELSDLLGLSQTTVSRALNGYPEVSEETRRKVKLAAETHSYQPSSHAKRLATGRTHTIGHVVPLSSHEMINPHFSDFIAGAGEAYARLGYDMLISVVTEADQERVYRNLASGRKVDGLIVHGPKAIDPRLALLKSLDIPFVVHGRSDDAPDSYSWLDVSNRRSFVRATQFLADLGHSRIALLNGLEDMNFARRRRAGFLDGLASRGIAPDPSIMFSDEMIEPNGYRRMQQLLAMPVRPDAILTASVLLAMGAARAIQDAGLKPGRDISIVTHDDQFSFLRDHNAVPMFTATRSSIRDAGRRCAEMIIELANNPDRAPIQELWEAELVLGSSTGPSLRLAKPAKAL
ncbi:MAG: substrate-binding domain-containing protein [Nitratireductor sp.]